MTNFDDAITEALIHATNIRGGDPCDVGLLGPVVAKAIENALYAASRLPVSKEVDEMSGSERIALAHNQGWHAALETLRA